MFGIGSTELLVILVVALVVLGPKSLPGIAKTMGKIMGEFRKVTTEFQRTMNAEVANEEHEKRKKEAAKDLFGDEEPVETVKKERKATQPNTKTQPEVAVAKVDASTVAPTPDVVSTPDVTASSEAELDPTSPLAQALAKAEAEAASVVDGSASITTDNVKDKA